MNTIGYVVGDFNNLPNHSVQVRLNSKSVLPALINYPYTATIFVHLPCSVLSCHNLSDRKGGYAYGYTKSIVNLTRPINGKIVIHFGSTTNGGSLDNVIEFCHRLEPYLGNRQLLLENSAGQGNYMGWSLQDLEYVYSRVDKTKIGFCFDTQHVFGAGTSHLQNIEEVREILDSMIAITGGIDLIHLNDSKVSFASRKDSHERLGLGYIWKDRIGLLHQTVLEFHRRGIPMIPETPDSYSDYIYTLQLLNAR